MSPPPLIHDISNIILAFERVAPDNIYGLYQTHHKEHARNLQIFSSIIN